MRNNEDNHYVCLLDDVVASRFSNTYKSFFKENNAQSREHFPLQVPQDPNHQVRQFFDMLSVDNNLRCFGCTTYTQMLRIGCLTIKRHIFACPIGCMMKYET